MFMSTDTGPVLLVLPERSSGRAKNRSPKRPKTFVKALILNARACRVMIRESQGWRTSAMDTVAPICPALARGLVFLVPSWLESVLCGMRKEGLREQ